MNFRPIYKDISIVSVANINRDVCNPINLFKHNFINREDIESINDKEMRVGADIVSFKTKAFELYCDGSRMQVRSEDTTRSEQLSDLMLNILRLSETTPKAIGVNATFRFVMDEISFLQFINRCTPMAAFTPMADNALMANLSFIDWNHPDNDGQPMAVFNINRLPDIATNQKVIQITINNHLEMKDGMNTVMYYLAETGNLHSKFFEKCRQFLNGIQ